MTTLRSPPDESEPYDWGAVEGMSVHVDFSRLSPDGIAASVRAEVRKQLRAAWLGNFVSCVLGVVLGVAVVLLAQKYGAR